MIVRSLEDVVGTERDMEGEGWRSRRLLLASDGMGFSMHDTTVAAGLELELEYRHHLEACYCVEGSGQVEAQSGSWELRPGTLYSADLGEEHRLSSATGMRLICVFNPPLRGDEVHNSNPDRPSGY